MRNMTKNYKYLWVLITAYTFVTVSSDLNTFKLVDFVWLKAPAGILFFSLTYFFIEIITEVYGYKRARFAIWNGALFCIIFILLAKFSTIFSSHNYAYSNEINIVFDRTCRVFMSTIATVIIAEHINAYLVAKLKLAFKGSYIGIRFILSSFIATGVSMFIFDMFAFFSHLSLKNFTFLYLSSWFYRYLTELILIPLSIKLANKLKHIEKTDIQDISTNYNIFKLESSYSEDKNFYI